MLPWVERRRDPLSWNSVRASLRGYETADCAFRRLNRLKPPNGPLTYRSPGNVPEEAASPGAQFVQFPRLFVVGLREAPKASTALNPNPRQSGIMCRKVVNVNMPICCGTNRSASTTKPYWQGRVCGTLLVRQVHKLNLGPCKTVALCATGLRPGLASTLKLKTVDITSLNPHEKLGGSNAARPSLHSHRYAVQRYHGLISPTAEASKPPAANVSRREANVGSLWGNGGCLRPVSPARHRTERVPWLDTCPAGVSSA